MGAFNIGWDMACIVQSLEQASIREGGDVERENKGIKMSSSEWLYSEQDNKQTQQMAGEITHQLRTFDAFLKVLSLVPRTQVRRLTTAWNFRSEASDALFWFL